ncbi:MAG: hypothetical protein WA655_04705 [Candidatus Korobacteraceae bacterium]
MPRPIKHEPITHRPRESSFVSLLSGWVQQGVENLLSTQRILVDLAMSQNTRAMNFLRERLQDPAFRPASILTEVASEGMSNFIEGQKLLLNLAQKEYEIVTKGVKQRVGRYTAVVAVTDLMQRSFDTFVNMQQDFLKTADKQTHTWLNAVKAGKPYDPEGLIELARDSFDTFVRNQKKFLDVVSEEMAKATSGKDRVAKKPVKKTQVTELAREATDSFIEAQKKLMDVAGRQTNAQVKAVEKTMDMLPAPPFINWPEMTRESVKSLVDAEKAVIDTVTKRHIEPRKVSRATRRRKRSARTKVMAPAGV